MQPQSLLCFLLLCVIRKRNKTLELWRCEESLFEEVATMDLDALAFRFINY